MDFLGQQMQSSQDSDGGSTCASSYLAYEEEHEALSTPLQMSNSLKPLTDLSLAKTEEGIDKFKNKDIETMLQNYKQLGGELETSLRVLENKHFTLNQTLIETTQECDILVHQEDIQRKNLFDLQIRLENLGAERVELMKENQKDKTEKIEAFTQEMQLIIENDEYIKTTYEKFDNILKAEQLKCESFLSSIKADTEFHKQSGENYIIEMRSSNKSFNELYNKLLDAANRTIDDLHQVFLSWKSVITNKKLRVNEIRSNKKKLDVLQADCQKLKQILIEKKNCLKNVENNYTTLDELHKRMLTESCEEISQLKLICQTNVEQIKKLHDTLSDVKRDFHVLELESTKLKADLCNVQQIYLVNSEDLCKLADEFKSKECYLILEKRQFETLEVESRPLSTLMDEFQQLTIQENVAQVNLEFVSKEEIELDGKKNILEREKQAMGSLKSVKLELENWKTQLQEAEEYEKVTSGLPMQHRNDFEYVYSEKQKIFEEVKLCIENQRRTENELLNKITAVEMEAQEIETEINTKLNLSIFVDDEILLETKEKDVQINNTEIDSLEEEFATYCGEIENLTLQGDIEENLDELNSDVNRIILQIEEATLYHGSQIESIESTFETQKQIWEDKIGKEIKDIEDKTKKEDFQTKKLTGAVPKLNTELNSLENELKMSLRSVASEIEAGLDVLEEISDYYKKCCLSIKQGKSPKATISRNLSSIEDQLTYPMKCMMSLEGVPKFNLEIPTNDCYKRILKAFREQFTAISNMENYTPLEMAAKVQDFGQFMYGKKSLKPNIITAVSDAEISSSTIGKY